MRVRSLTLRRLEMKSIKLAQIDILRHLALLHNAQQLPDATLKVETKEGQGIDAIIQQQRLKHLCSCFGRVQGHFEWIVKRGACKEPNHVRVDKRVDEGLQRQHQAHHGTFRAFLDNLRERNETRNPIHARGHAREDTHEAVKVRIPEQIFRDTDGDNDLGHNEQDDRRGKKDAPRPVQEVVAPHDDRDENHAVREHLFEKHVIVAHAGPRRKGRDGTIKRNGRKENNLPPRLHGRGQRVVLFLPRFPHERDRGCNDQAKDTNGHVRLGRDRGRNRVRDQVGEDTNEEAKDRVRGHDRAAHAERLALRELNHARAHAHEGKHVANVGERSNGNDGHGHANISVALVESIGVSTQARDDQEAHDRDAQAHDQVAFATKAKDGVRIREQAKEKAKGRGNRRDAMRCLQHTAFELKIVHEHGFHEVIERHERKHGRERGGHESDAIHGEEVEDLAFPETPKDFGVIERLVAARLGHGALGVSNRGHGLGIAIVGGRGRLIRLEAHF
ncbi:hypothetical protein PsorP6_009769 [Peronosclerospora sorghi]|uniref:Uncharacterized protein n=1 Tax=Peronosclerospora sorghi TaxID=230839 RepID=A0ACC0VYU8_9STRA|nr:hypothetical protein PsorP6_009769 [Peronosclerospora sorghi]